MSEERTRPCNACGHLVVAGARFCGRCGAPLPPLTRGRGRRWWWIGAGVLVVAALTLGAVVWWARVPRPDEGEVGGIRYVSRVYGFGFEVPTGAEVALPAGRAGTLEDARDLVVRLDDSVCSLSVHVVGNREGLSPQRFVAERIAAATPSGDGDGPPALGLIDERRVEIAGVVAHEVVRFGFDAPVVSLFAGVGEHMVEVAAHCATDDGAPDGAADEARRIIVGSLRVEAGGSP